MLTQQTAKNFEHYHHGIRFLKRMATKEIIYQQYMKWLLEYNF